MHSLSTKEKRVYIRRIEGDLCYYHGGYGRHRVGLLQQRFMRCWDDHVSDRRWVCRPSAQPSQLLTDEGTVYSPELARATHLAFKVRQSDTLEDVIQRVQSTQRRAEQAPEQLLCC